jgi:Bacteriocin class II with double-glycine leader peptide
MQQELTMMTVDNRTELGQVKGGLSRECAGGIFFGGLAGAEIGGDFGPWGALIGYAVGGAVGALYAC